MQSSIYYPSFEVHQQNWLKFSLLYLDELSPIIPPEGDKYLSDDYKFIQDHTDLIKVHRPSHEEGHAATLDAIEVLERIIAYPVAYEALLGESNLLNNWRSKEQQTSTLFKEKYSIYWEEFCIENGFGHHTKEGLLLSEHVVLIYMTILAQCIADARGVTSITDNPYFDKFSVLSRKDESKESSLVNTAQTIINLSLPRNLRELSFEDIIFHRNRDGFKEKQQAFHKELDSSLTKAESNEIDFDSFLGSSWNDFSDDIALIGTGTITFGFGVWLMFKSDVDQTHEAIKEILGATTSTVGGVIAVRNTWKNTESKRMARRYLSNLNSI